MKRRRSPSSSSTRASSASSSPAPGTRRQPRRARPSARTRPPRPGRPPRPRASGLRAARAGAFQRLRDRKLGPRLDAAAAALESARELEREERVAARGLPDPQQRRPRQRRVQPRPQQLVQRADAERPELEVEVRAGRPRRRFAASRRARRHRLVVEARRARTGEATARARRATGRRQSRAPQGPRERGFGGRSGTRTRRPLLDRPLRGRERERGLERLRCGGGSPSGTAPPRRSPSRRTRSAPPPRTACTRARGSRALAPPRPPRARARSCRSRLPRDDRNGRQRVEQRNERGELPSLPTSPLMPVAILRYQYDQRVAVTSKPPALDPLDLLALDALFDDEERAIRDTVRRFVRERVLPDVGDWFEEAHLAAGARQGARAARALRHAPRRLGLPGRELGRLRPDVHGARGGRLGHPQPRLRPGLAGDVRDLALGLRGAEAALAAAMHAGEAIGCFGLTEPDTGSDPGAMRTRARRDGGGLGAERDEDVDHERVDRGRRGGVGAHRGRRDPRLPRRAVARRLSAPGSSKKLSLRASVTSELVLDDVRVPAESMLPGGRPPSRAALVPERGSLRDRLGLGRRGARLLRGGARVREGADRLREADLRVPAHAAEARRDGAGAQPGPPSSPSTSVA